MKVGNPGNNKVMKRSIFALISSLFIATGCYEDYVQDFDYSAVFIAYQYDLRTFVLDEGEQFKFTVALGGVMQNGTDRNIVLVPDERLILGAMDGMKNSNLVSGSYVVSEIKEAGVTALNTLPESYYTVDGLDGLTIQKGSHTAAVTVRATERMRSDEKAFIPYYAIAYRIENAQADTVIQGKDFGVVAVKCENRFYGNWARSGRVVSFGPDGSEISSTYQGKDLSDTRVYKLSTVDGLSLKTDKVAGESGSMILTVNGSKIEVSSPDGKVRGEGSFEADGSLQDRRIFLDYTVTSDDNSRLEVTDTLYFRNRIRDGVNEWQN